jgi:outer membrane receptor protein involved in Fe transport
MEKFYKHLLGPLLVMLLAASTAFAQTAHTTVTGTVKDDKGESLAGVNIFVKGRVIGTLSSGTGQFNLKVDGPPPFALKFSIIGYKEQEIQITEAATTLDIKLVEDITTLGDVVITDAPIDDRVLDIGSVETMNILGVQNTASENYYKGLINMKGLDMTTSSINFQIINTRGFNSTGNTRFVQLTDGMDTQAPALNFPIGNLNGPSELDVESVDLIPGAASALYGPNAFNGILLVNSKSPFDYQGLSAFAKFSMNHLGDSDLDSEEAGEIGPGSAQPIYEGAIRYAKAFNNKFAFKVALSYSEATDWYGTNLKDKNAAFTPAGYSFNPGADRVHAFGDEVATNIALVGLDPSFQAGINNAGLGAYLGDIPSEIVSRTPYEEQYQVDYNAKNIKANVGLHYRLTDKVELLYNLNYGAGTTVYSGAQRYSLSNFNIQQHKVELKGDNFFLRGYTTIEDSGDSYIADLVGVLVNREWKADNKWFGDYTGAYLGYLAANGIAPGASDVQERQNAHGFARQVADGYLLPNGSPNTGADLINYPIRYEPGTSEFNAAKNNALKDVIPTGALFDDQTKLYHAEGQFNFKNQIDFMDLIAGASYRVYDLNSNGTIFADTAGNDITIQEVGAYVQASKKILNDKFKLTGSLRFDKNENFDEQFNPRISGVYSFTPNQNLRVSYQTGFRNPTTQGQHIDLNVLTYRLLGGLPQYAQSYNVFENAYTVASVNRYIAEVSNLAGTGAYTGSNTGLAIGDPTALAQLEAVTGADPVKPERVQSIEFGYKALIGNSLFIDLAYYRNSYEDFISQVILRQSSGPIDFSATTVTEQNVRNAQTLLTPGTDATGRHNSYSVYTNLDKTVTAQGFVFGADYALSKGYKIGFNYNWNKLNEELGDGYLSEFNTPEHKFNVTFGNRKVTENLGFNIAYRWQDEFLWEATFAQGIVPAVGIFDAQVSYKLKNMKSVIKLGGSDLFNTRYVLNYGGPTLGAIYYVSITFDELMN